MFRILLSALLIGAGIGANAQPYPVKPVRIIVPFAPVVDRLNAEVSMLLELKETADQLQNDGVSPAGGTPEEFLAAITKDIELWRRVVAEAGVKPE